MADGDVLSPRAPGVRDWLFRLCAAGFVASGVYHAVGLVRPEWLVFQPAWRHALFVAINAFFAAAFLKRPWFLPWVFGVLAVEQIYGHGVRAWEILQAERRIDWPGVVVLVGVPAMLALLIVDARERRRVATRSAPPPPPTAPGPAPA